MNTTHNDGGGSQHRLWSSLTDWPGACLLLVACSVGVWLQRGVFEDGFIYLRVAENLSGGAGMVYNPGFIKGSETTTDFLFTILVASIMAVGSKPIPALHLLSMVIYTSCLALTWHLAVKLSPRQRQVAVIAVLLVGTHYSFTRFAATGFGVVLQALMALVALLSLMKFIRNADFLAGVLLGLALSLLIICRLDSAIYVLPVACAATIAALIQRRKAIFPLLIAGGISVVVLLTLLSWKLYYYDSVLPATYYTKARSSLGGFDQRADLFDKGLAYLVDYWSWYMLWVLAIAAICGCWKARNERGGGWNVNQQGTVDPRVVRGLTLVTMLGMVIMYQGYMAYTGGDYYGYRLLMSQVPIMMLVFAVGMGFLTKPVVVAILASVMTASYAYNHFGEGKYSLDRDLALPSDNQPGPYRYEAGDRHIANYIAVGKALHNLVQQTEPGRLGNTDIKIATTTLGAIGYYSGLHTIEMHGLNDMRIAAADAGDLWLYPGNKIGHRQIARPSLLAELGVNFIVTGSTFPLAGINLPINGTMNQLPHALFVDWVKYITETPKHAEIVLNSDSQLLLLPLGNGMVTVIYYLTRTAQLDEMLDKAGIIKFTICCEEGQNVKVATTQTTGFKFGGLES